MLSKIKRPLMAVVLVMGLGMTIASAYDYCSPCAPVAPRPVAVYTPRLRLPSLSPLPAIRAARPWLLPQPTAAPMLFLSVPPAA